MLIDRYAKLIDQALHPRLCLEIECTKNYQSSSVFRNEFLLVFNSALFFVYFRLIVGNSCFR